MEYIDLSQAIVEIKQAFPPKDQTQATHQLPFFFIVGAGISAPSIPLAEEIIRECEKKALSDFENSLPGAPGSNASPMAKYSYYMKTAYPHAELRQAYIKTLIHDKPISLANLRLAHILGSKNRVARLVVTPNFDDHLSRSLNLFGIEHVICDHPATTARVSLKQDAPITILHVHGTYWFYDCCNLDGEIIARAGSQPESQSPDYPNPRGQAASSMSEMLGNILRDSSPIVIGYSGWENDVIMQALKQRLDQPEGRLPYNLYWFCYRSTDVISLPKWLKDNGSVKIIAPPAKKTIASRSETADDQLIDESGLNQNVQNSYEYKAQMLFDEIIRQFKMEIPILITDPLSVFAEQLSRIGSDKEKEREIYSFKDVKQNVEKAEKWLLLQQQVAKSKLDAARGFMQQAKYLEALKQLSIAEIEQLEPKIEQVLNWIEIALDGLPRTEKALEACGFAIRILSHSPMPPGSQNRVNILYCSALLLKAVILDSLDKHQEEIVQYDELLRRFGAAPEPALKERVAKALFNKGVTLGQMNKPQEEIAAYDELLRRFGTATEPALQEQVAMALFNKGNTLKQMETPQDAVAAYDELVKRFGAATEPALQEKVAMALFNKGNTLGQMNKPQEEIAAYDELVKRFGTATEPALQEMVASALWNHGLILLNVNKPEGATSLFNESLKRVYKLPSAKKQQFIIDAADDRPIFLMLRARYSDAQYSELQQVIEEVIHLLDGKHDPDNPDSPATS